MNMLLKTIFVFACVSLSHCYPSGAPLSACSSMFPKHGVEPMTKLNPFKITAYKLPTGNSYNGNSYK